MMTSVDGPLELPLSEETLAAVNEHLRSLDPPEILRWALSHLPRLFQTTAFGLTGLVAIDMLSKIAPTPATQPPLIFIDTLYSSETYAIVAQVEQRYGVKVNVFKPEECTTQSRQLLDMAVKSKGYSHFLYRNALVDICEVTKVLKAKV